MGCVKVLSAESREQRCQIVPKLNREEGPALHCSGALSEDDCLIVITGPWYSSELQPWFRSHSIITPRTPEHPIEPIYYNITYLLSIFFS